jgi:hypothetical protein
MMGSIGVGEMYMTAAGGLEMMNECFDIGSEYLMHFGWASATECTELFSFLAYYNS